MEFLEKTVDGSLDGSVAPTIPIGPLSQSIHYDVCNFTSGGPLTITNSSEYLYGIKMYQASALGSPISVFNYSFLMAPGTYNLKIFGNKSPTGGIFSFSVDDGNHISFDTYASATTPGMFYPGSTKINLTTDGYHTLNVFCSGKNSSSTGYGGYFYKFLLALY